MPLRFGHIELFVKDPSRSKQFYRDVLSFEVVAEQGPDHVWLKSGEVEILLRRAPQDQASAASYQRSSAGLVVYTDDLPATLESLAAHGLTPSGDDGSAKCPTFVDPDGHWIQIVNPKEH